MKTRYLIFNAFEAAIAVHFLNKERVMELAYDAAAANIGIYQINEWTTSVSDSMKTNIQFDPHQKQLILYGVMCEEDSDKLLKAATSQAQKVCIESLYQQSVLNPVNDIL